jgi:hypothetical protein
MLKKPDIPKVFIIGMSPIAASLKSDLLGLNQQLEEIDKQIAFFAGIIFDANQYKDKPTIKEISSAWSVLKANKILEESEVISRIKRESDRYAFFNELHEVFNTLIEGEKFLIDKRIEEEKQKRMQERREAAEAARRAKAEARAALSTEEEQSTLELIITNMEEEKEMALSYEKLIEAKKNWKRLVTLQTAQFQFSGLLRNVSNQRESSEQAGSSKVAGVFSSLLKKGPPATEPNKESETKGTEDTTKKSETKASPIVESEPKPTEEETPKVAKEPESKTTKESETKPSEETTKSSHSVESEPKPKKEEIKFASLFSSALKKDLPTTEPNKESETKGTEDTTKESETKASPIVESEPKPIEEETPKAAKETTVESKSTEETTKESETKHSEGTTKSPHSVESEPKSKEA